MSDSHELAVFLQLYGAEQWVRRTGMYPYLSIWFIPVILLNNLVSGEANFCMTHTGLTLGGFIQPSVARHLIEIPANIENMNTNSFLILD